MTTIGNLRVRDQELTVLTRHQIRVDRGSPFGNPYRVGPSSAAGHGTLEEVLNKYAHYLVRLVADPDIARRFWAMKGQELLCWCRPREGFQGRLLCHAQIIWAALEGRDPREAP